MKIQNIAAAALLLVVVAGVRLGKKPVFSNAAQRKGLVKASKVGKDDERR